MLGQRRAQRFLARRAQRRPLDPEPASREAPVGQGIEEKAPPLVLDGAAGDRAGVPLHVAPDVAESREPARLEILQPGHDERRLALDRQQQREGPGVRVGVEARQVLEVRRGEEEYPVQARLASPASQSLMSQRLEPHEQGQLQGALTSLMAFSGLFGPGLFTQVFASAIDPKHGLHLPGAPFFVSSALLVLALVVAERATRGRSSRAAR